MTKSACTHTLLTALCLAVAVPAHAQLGGIGGALKKAQASKQAFDDMNITDAEERQIGEEVSVKLRDRFGVVQDPAIHKYVSLIGMTLAKQSERPGLDWNFIVLDTDGVNAYASPGGLVHITRGALAIAMAASLWLAVVDHVLCASLFCAAAASIGRHRENIKRLRAGTEPKLTFKKKKP